MGARKAVRDAPPHREKHTVKHLRQVTVQRAQMEQVEVVNIVTFFVWLGSVFAFAKEF